MSRKKKKKKKPNESARIGPPPMLAALAWYKPEQWSRLREVSVDRDDLEDTFQEWVTGAEALSQAMREAGMHVEQVEIDVDDLVDWCRRNKRPVDSAARSELAIEKAQERQARDGNDASEGP